MTKTDSSHTVRADARVLVMAPDAALGSLADRFADTAPPVLAVTDAADLQEQSTDDAALAIVHPDVADVATLGKVAAIQVLLDVGTPNPELTALFDFHLSADEVERQLESLLGLGTKLMELSRRCVEFTRDRDGECREFTGCSVQVRRLNTSLRRAMDSDAIVLIEGRSGTGKSRAARLIHQGSRRSVASPIVRESAAVPADDLLQLLEECTDTTLVLEDIEQLPAKAQAELVRFIKERTRSTTQTPAPRIVATTSARLPELVARGQFREDLFYRLNMFPILLPMLRERREDIANLAEELASEGFEGEVKFTPAAMILLESHPWEGNTSQLANVIRRARSLAGDQPIDRMHLLGPSTGLSVNLESPMDLDRRTEEREEEDLREEDIRPLQEEEERLLNRALKATRGNVRRAAQLLGIGRATLYRKIQVYKLNLT